MDRIQQNQMEVNKMLDDLNDSFDATNSIEVFDPEGRKIRQKALLTNRSAHRRLLKMGFGYDESIKREKE